MARSPTVTSRLENLETDVALLKHNAVHVADILVDHSGRLDRLQRSLDGLERRFDGLERRFDGLERRFDDFEASIGSRLDRLIAITTDERTAHYERLRSLEDRVAKLEDDG